MNKSESINELATALSKAQSEIEDATKDKNGHKYKYADLSQILQIVRPSFTKHGLAVSQFPTDSGDNVAIDTILMHSSGQWLSSSFSMSVETTKNMTKAQASGSVITYMRRYALAAVAGITQEDNDAAGERKKCAQASNNHRVAHLKLIAMLIDQTKTDVDVFIKAMKFGVADLNALSEEQCLRSIAALEKKKSVMDKEAESGE